MRNLNNVDPILLRLVEDHVIANRPNPQIYAKLWAGLTNQRTASQAAKAVKKACA
jgi:hypothetical protein